MERDAYFPLFISPWNKNSSGIEIVTTNDTLSFGGLTVKAMSKIAWLCNGRNTLEYVFNELCKEWASDDVSSLFTLFIEKRVVVNSHNMSGFFGDVSRNPMVFSPDLSRAEIDVLIARARENAISLKNEKTIELVYDLENDSRLLKLLSKRGSCRNFAGQGISSELLSLILWSAYGIQSDQDTFYRRTVPSAGALYPLSISLLLFQDCGDVKKGVYKISYTENSVHLNIVNESLSAYCVCFSDWATAKNSTGVIVVEANYAISAEKYGNRAMQYAHIEIGHVAQNINLVCEEYGLGALEMGGFNNDHTSQMIQTNEGYMPLHTIVFGVPSNDFQKSGDKNINTLVKFPNDSDTLPIPYTVVYAKVESENGETWCSGKGMDITTATQKAISEIAEWKAWKMQNHFSKPMKISTRVKLRYLNPREVVCYHKRQYKEKGFAFHPFDIKTSYQWIEAEDLNEKGEKVYVLADHLLFPYASKQPLYTFSTTSGCAAHVNKQKAVEHAIFELVERDAFMIFWLNRLDCPLVDLQTIPDSFKTRIEKIQELGFEIVVRDISVGIAPVLFICVKSNTNNYLTCGIGSSNDVVSALDSALCEVELSVIHFLDNRKKKAKSILVKDVSSLEEHEQLYTQKKYINKASFLFASTSKKVSLAEIESAFADLVSGEQTIVQKIIKLGFEAFVVDATDWKYDVSLPEERVVVRVVVPGLIPLSFGYHREPLGMERIYSVPVVLGFLSKKTEYGKLNRVPHPLN